MTKTEKRIFRLEMKKANSNISVYSKVFDGLSKMEVYSQEKINVYIKKQEIANPNSVVNYLFDKLVDYMSVVRLELGTDVEASNVKKITSRAHTTYKLGLVKHAHKLWKRSLSLSLKQEKYDLSAQAIYSLIDLERQYNLTGMLNVLSAYDANDKSAKDAYVKYLRLSEEIRTLDSFILYGLDIVYDYSSVCRKQEWEDIFDNRLFKEDLDTFGYSHKIKILTIHVLFHYAERNIGKSICFIERLMDTYYLFPEKTIREFRNFIIHYYYYCWLLKITNDEKLSHHVKKYCDLMTDWKEHLKDVPLSEVQFFHFVHSYYKITATQLQLMSSEAFEEEDINQLVSFESKYSSGIMDDVAFRITVRNAFLYLLLGKYEKYNLSIDTLNQNDTFFKMDIVLEWELELLELIASFENNVRTYFSNQLSRLLMRRRRSPVSSLIINYMLDFLKLFKSSKKKFVISKEQVEAAKEKEAKTILKTILFSVWLERKYEAMQLVK